MAYISNKDKKYMEKKEAEEKNTFKNPDYKFATKDPSKSRVWKVLNFILVTLMILAPFVGIIFFIVNAANN